MQSLKEVYRGRESVLSANHSNIMGPSSYVTWDLQPQNSDEKRKKKKVCWSLARAQSCGQAKERFFVAISVARPLPSRDYPQNKENHRNPLICGLGSRTDFLRTCISDKNQIEPNPTCYQLLVLIQYAFVWKRQYKNNEKTLFEGVNKSLLISHEIINYWIEARKWITILFFSRTTVKTHSMQNQNN